MSRAATAQASTTLPPDVYRLLLLLTDVNSSLLRPVHAHRNAESRALAARRISDRANQVLRDTTKEPRHG